MIRLALSTATLLTLCCGSIHSQVISEIVVFGDSGSDVGNTLPIFGIPASPPYFKGRYSNGPMWVERLAELLEVSTPQPSESGGTNYAYGGATTGSNAGFDLPNLLNMDAQVRQFLAAEVPRTDQLFVMWGGYNDFFFGQSDVGSVVDSLGDQILDLQSAGARNFLVLDLQQPITQEEREFLTPSVVSQFNSLLTQKLEQISKGRNMDISEFDVSRVLENVSTSPADYGFTHVMEPACLDCSELNADAVQISNNPDQHILWDDTHLSAATNRIVGDAAFEALPESIRPNNVSLISTSSNWKHFAGLAEPSAFPGLGWTLPSFNDKDWNQSTAGFGYGNDDLRFVETILEGMRGEHSSLYLRHDFVVEDKDGVTSLNLHIDYDDAFVAYINGTEVARSAFGEPATPVGFDERPGRALRESSFRDVFRIDLSEFSNLLQDGDNVLAIQGINRSLRDSDFVLSQLQLTAAVPEPGAEIFLSWAGVAFLIGRRQRVRYP